VIATKGEERKDMATIIATEQLRHGITFQGEAYAGIPFSLYWMQFPLDEGPRLHVHLYDEIFLILEGQATFPGGESMREVKKCPAQSCTVQAW
jgi:mannose-6-phosphate isomerase-like protein (cupin superfamily)